MAAQYGWGILWRSNNKLDGERRMLIGHAYGRQVECEAGCYPYAPAGAVQHTLTYKTKREAAAAIKEHFGYIAKRKDLRMEPHGWRMPVPVKVIIEVRIV